MLMTDYIAVTPPSIPEWLVVLAEQATIATSLLGMVVAAHLVGFFGKSRNRLATKLKFEYFTDMLGFLVLFVMGTALYLNLPWLVKVDVIVRPFVVCLNIYAMWRLYSHYSRG